VTNYLMLVGTNPLKDCDDDLNSWYDNNHLADILSVDGVISAQRYRVVEMAPPQVSTHQYFAIYQVETDDAADVRHAIRDAAVSGRFSSTEALDRASVLQVFLEPIGGPRTNT
jgi:hypothetical protein